MQSQTPPTERRTLSTEQAAAALLVRPATLRSSICIRGHYCNIRPVKLPNRLLAWPADEVLRVANGVVQ